MKASISHFHFNVTIQFWYTLLLLSLLTYHHTWEENNILILILTTGLVNYTVMSLILSLHSQDCRSHHSFGLRRILDSWFHDQQLTLHSFACTQF
jgi:threonine/homoserine/homoserine lactone efflux protein